MRRLATVALALLAASCTTVPGVDRPGGFALPAVTGDALTDSALALAASERAPDAAARAPLIARLDSAGVRPVQGIDDDPLTGWRAEGADQGQVYRGRALGPAYRRARLAPGGRLRLEQIFLAGERAEIAASANGADDLTLAVRNPREEAVCDTAFAPAARCRWLPLFTERYAIELVNRGTEPASVYLVFR